MCRVPGADVVPENLQQCLHEGRPVMASAFGLSVYAPPAQAET